MTKNKTTIPRAQIGIFGGSGLYDLLENPKEIKLETPFGKPSDKIKVGQINKRRVAFIPRHGSGHTLPPHQIPFKANLWAFKQMGIKQIISPLAVGSLNPHIKPGDFVICDQFVNWTKDRDDTFYHGKEVAGVKHSNKVVHVSMADPYCPKMCSIAVRSCKKLNIPHHPFGTVVVISGPRFSSRAESRFFTKSGFDIINMTAYPEVALARELEICYLNIGLVTDFDTGLHGIKNIKPVSSSKVIKVFKQNNHTVKELIFEVVKNLEPKRTCSCGNRLADAVI